MPDINESTPRQDVTINGETFKVAQPFTAGYTLNSNEAAALNQTFAENIRNNLASKVKEAKEAGSFDVAEFQSQVVDEYVDSYEFGVRTGGGGRTSDPVMAEALEIARTKVRAALQKAGHKLSDIAAAEVTRLAKEAIGKNPQILDLAKARVAAASEITVDMEDLQPATTKAA